MRPIPKLKGLSEFLGLAQKQILTFNIYSGGIRFVTTDGHKITGWGEKELDDNAVVDGLIASPNEVSKAIEEVVSQLSLPDRLRVVSAVSGMRTLPRLIHIPHIDRKLLGDAVRFESERQMPLPLNELYVTENQLEDTDAGHLFFVIGIPYAPVEAHMETLSLAQMRFAEVDLKPIALARVVSRDQALILDLEPGYTEVVLVTDGVPILMRTIIMGGKYMSIDERVKQVSVEVSRTIDYHNSTNPQSPFDSNQPMFLTGKLVYANSLVELLKSSVANPIEQIQTDIELPERFPVSEYAVNLGLMKKRPLGEKLRSKSSFPALDVKIVPPGYNILSSPMKSLLLGLLAAIVLILLIPMVKFDMDRNIEAAGLTQELDQINQSLVDVRELSKSLRETKTEASQLLEETNTILGTGNAFASGLDSVFKDIPAQISLDSISISNTVISVDGLSSDRSSVIQYASNIESLEGIASVQITSMTAIETETGESISKFSISILR